MAKVKTVTLRRGATVNMGNYESERYEVEISVDLDKGDDPGVIAEEFGEECNRLLALQMLHRLNAGGRDSIVGKIVHNNISIDPETKIRQLSRFPEYAWINRLYPQYRAELDNYIREGVRPTPPPPEPYASNERGESTIIEPPISGFEDPPRSE